MCKVQKSLYGLKQAPRAWFTALSHALIKLGLTTSKCDSSLFIKNLNGETLYVLTYVDDIVITENSRAPISRVINQLNGLFLLKDLGCLNYFLGVQVTHLKDGGLQLSQTKYIKEFLQKAQMGNHKSLSTHMVVGQKLSKLGNDDFNNHSLYKSVVGALQHLEIRLLKAEKREVNKNKL